VTTKKATNVVQSTEYESTLYESREQAEEALKRLQAIGYGREQISLALREGDLPADQNFSSDTSPLAERGAMGEHGQRLGAIAGGLIGTIAAAAITTAVVLAEGIAVIVGPVAILLAGAAGGLASGSIVGALLELGVEAEDWRAGLQRGGVGVIVALRSHADRAAVRKALMNW
jgi:hypothetical protein